MSKVVWSVYQIAGEAYSSKLLGHYCKPSIAYSVAIKNHLQMEDVCFLSWSYDKMCLRQELTQIHNSIMADKNKYLVTPIFIVKENTNMNKNCSECSDPVCLR